MMYRLYLVITSVGRPCKWTATPEKNSSSADADVLLTVFEVVETASLLCLGLLVDGVTSSPSSSSSLASSILDAETQEK